MEQLRSKCMLAAKLVNDCLDHMEEIMEVAELEAAPEYTDKLLYAQADITTAACDNLKKLHAEYSKLPDACKATLMHMDDTFEEFAEMKEDYTEHMKEGNPY